MSNIEEIIAELERFSKKLTWIGSSLVDGDVIDFELRYQLRLPMDFKIFLKKFNGFSLAGAKILGFNRDADSINSVYHYEHTMVAYPQYDFLVPFHNDGRGNFYCHDTRQCNINEDQCQVVFWVSNKLYSETDPPEVVNESFSDFVREVIIGWYLDDYDYNGRAK